jgi:hypothetical protein
MAEKVQYTQYSQLSKWNAFSEGTFRHLLKEPSITLSEDNIFRFTLPKSRYTSRIFLLVEGTCDLTHASATTWNAVKHRHAPYNLIKNIKVDASGLAQTINVSGHGLHLINRCTPGVNAYNMNTSTSYRSAQLLTDLAGSSATSNTFRFLLEIPFQLNNRDYVGLINTTDQNLNVNIEILTANFEDLFTATTGYTVGTPSWTLTPFIESFSPVMNTLPGADPADELIKFDVVKMIQEQTFTISASGEFIIKLPVGQKYRRVILDFYGSTAATALTDAQVTQFTMALNQADSPHVLTSTQLMTLNHLELPSTYAPKAGVFNIDLTNQGFINYGGSRDYIETYGLNEFWLKCQIASGVTGSVRATYETLQKLGA